MQLITLVDLSSGSVVTIAPERGALVTSFRVGDRELLYLDATTLVDPAKNVRGGIPVLFPSPGKLADDEWHFGEQSGHLKQHGFARNLPWTVIENDAAAVSLVLTSSEQTLQVYPWHFTAILNFSLSESRLRIGFKIKNRSATTMPFGIGYHPYFQVTEKATARIDTNATRAFDNVVKHDVAFTAFDLTQSEVDLHLLNHSSDASTLHVNSGAIEVSASQDFKRWVVWTLKGKDFVCLEPWSSAGNALNSGDGLLTLAAGQLHESWIEIAYRANSRG